MKTKELKISIIGAGAMGGSLTRGLVTAGYAPELITVSNPSPGRLESLESLKVRTTCNNLEAVKDADIVVVAVKPWIMPQVAEQLSAAIGQHQQVVAIVAGIKGNDLQKMWQGVENLSIVMPNTAMSLAKSMTFIVNVCGVMNYAEDIFSLVGKVMCIEERLLGAATSLASCGIAYALRYVRAATEGGVELGFAASKAQDIVVGTMEGAAALLSRSGAHAEAEIDKVTTPGGLTIKGLNAMEQSGFSASVVAGLKASIK